MALTKAMTALLAKRDDLQAKIASIESGLRYYDRSAKPHETGEDKLSAMRRELAEVLAKLKELIQP